jgi:hypothetical protein
LTVMSSELRFEAILLPSSNEEGPATIANSAFFK